MIKSEVVEEKKNRQFPKLMIDKESGQIVLMHMPKCGTAINSITSDPGQHFNCLVMENFEDFEGSITLSNE